ncbi:hypothetical protein PTSG_05954 [Salpingoeca rosetta]|uniref:C-terminal of Roc (COR) domain-containing protein n=1 Tax=Salpingoeca rosetta (strain ATCC 50818 / BSB-021) TaxID=946362 RepID=F2UD94_SALR5|nr:uncharacterized protein PTSG_05954 [Salpingoeca rosetta]EGD74589.1 hypothetical protein PTSG_05954 [Salpingoeca rosetta]|eukprot:XP_004992846.1 hypothetical protein PTSG_05954 [Salpingoeca rosetta]
MDNDNGSSSAPTTPPQWLDTLVHDLEHDTALSASVVFEDFPPSMQRRFVEALAKNTSVQSIEIIASPLSVINLQLLAETTPSLPHVHSLDLVDNNFDTDFDKPLASLLAKLPNLESLRLNGCNLQSQAAIVLAEPLANLKELRRIQLASDNLDDDSIRVLAKSLANLPNLHQINLDGNRITAVGAQAVIETACKLEHFDALRLNDNLITSVGFQEAAAMLKSLKHLRYLDFRNNGLSCDGVKMLTQSFPQLTELQKLFLDGNRIGTEGVRVLAPVVGSMDSLQELDLTNNGITHLGPEFLATTNIYQIGFEGNPLVCPPAHIVVHSRAMTYAYLRAVSQGSELLTRSRLVFIGDGGVGKTTLKTALLMLHSADRAHVLNVVRQAIKKAFSKYTEADFREWVDHDLNPSDQPGFFDQCCQKAKGITGKLWLKSPDDKLRAWFGGDAGTAQAEQIVDRMLQARQFILASGATAPQSPPGQGDAPPFEPLLYMPHVWTEGVEVDHWDAHDFEIWDFAGELEFFPTHELFLASHMAVYLLVFDASQGFDHALARVCLWLELLRTCTPPALGHNHDHVQVRLVATKDVSFSLDYFRSEVKHHASSCFDLGPKCYRIEYTEADGGDLMDLDTELARLRTEGVPYFHVPTGLTDIKKHIQEMARAHATRDWPVVNVSTIDWKHNHPELAVLFLLHTAVIYPVPGNPSMIVLDPMVWLTKLLSALLHPLHGLSLSFDAASPQASSSQIHLPAVDTSHVLSSLAQRDLHIPQQQRHLLLPFLSSFNICFSVNTAQTLYTFPSLLPRRDVHPGIITAIHNTVPGLAASQRVVLGRRLQCFEEHEWLPPTAWPLVVKELFAAVNEAGATPLHLSAGIFIAQVDLANYIVASLTLLKHRRCVDIVAVGSQSEVLLHTAMLCVVKVLRDHFPSLHLQKRCLMVASQHDHDQEQHAVLQLSIVSHSVYTEKKAVDPQDVLQQLPTSDSGPLSTTYAQRLRQLLTVEDHSDSPPIRRWDAHWVCLLTDPKLVSETNIPKAKQNAETRSMFADVCEQLLHLSEQERVVLSTHCGLHNKPLDGSSMVLALKSTCPIGSTVPYLSEDSDLQPLHDAIERRIGHEHITCVIIRERQAKLKTLP